MKALKFTLLIALTINFAYAENFSCRESVPDDFFDSWLEEKPDYQRSYYEEKIAEEGKEEVLKDLSFDAINHYTGPGYIYINRDLRSGKISIYSRENIKFMCFGLELLPEYTGTSFRLTNLPQDIIDYYIENVGNIITEKPFLSSSSSRLGARTYSVLNAVHPNIQFIIKSKTGRKISKQSEFKIESEVLYPAGSTFLITKVKEADDEDGLTKIWMTQVE